MSHPESQTQPQQSWAAWILDAYANSVVTSHDNFEDLSDDSSYDTTSSTTSEMGNAPSASPYGPYVRTGRGGAGNFTWQSDQQHDAEAQIPKTLKEKRNVTLTLEHVDTSTAVRHSQARRNMTYPRIGRGGAGNVVYHQSNEIQQSPTASNFCKSPVSATSSPVLYTGRGGAGNFGAAKSTSDLARLAREQQEQADAAKRREFAEQEVHSLLQAPTQAYVGSRRRSALPEDVDSWTQT